MPQMAPMNWTLLFLMFISIYLIAMVVIYFSSKPKVLPSSTTIFSSKESSVSWMW